MKFGVREICNVVLRAKTKMTLGSRTFFANEPVIYFDTLKTSSVEGAATTVYAQGGRGNARLMAWDGERTVTFTMEDALISPEGFMILSGAGVIDAKDNTMQVHTTATVQTSDAYKSEDNTIALPDKAKAPSTIAGADAVYVIALDRFGNFNSEPFIAESVNGKTITLKATDDLNLIEGADMIFVDYYYDQTAGKQIDITAELKGHDFYLEADTLFRSESGEDLPAVFIIPKCRVQSNFTFTMASSGDPSSFTFTMDAFPDYTRFDKTEKVMASIQIVEEDDGGVEADRPRTEVNANTKPATSTKAIVVKAGEEGTFSVNPTNSKVVSTDTAVADVAIDAGEVTVTGKVAGVCDIIVSNGGDYVGVNVTVTPSV